MKRTRDSGGEDDTSADSDRDVAITPASKIVTLENGDASTEATATAIQCSLPGHTPGLRFSSYDEYEGHYNKAHTNRCLECRRNFPSAHVLDLHILEHHDALAKIRREKGESIYACFVETCGEKFKGTGKRQDHLVKSHKYPTNYFFAVTKFGVDGRKSMLVDGHKRQGNRQKDPRNHKPEEREDKASGLDGEPSDTTTSKDLSMGEAGITVGEPQGTTNQKRVAAKEKRETANMNQAATDMEQGEPAVDAEMEDLAGAISALRFVPRAVRLGPKHEARLVRR